MTRRACSWGRAAVEGLGTNAAMTLALGQGMPVGSLPMPAAPRPTLDQAAIEGALERFRAAGIGTGSGTASRDVPAAGDADAPGRRDGLIPAPPGDGTIGPFSAYGMIIGAGGLAAYGMFRSGAVANGVPAAKLAGIVGPAVLAGVVGARLYHVATDWEHYRDNLGDIPRIWEGGGAIYGGIGAGVLVGAAMARRAGLQVSPLLDAAALALPVAQAVGRFGNYANQELFGRPTDLPWGLQVDPEHRPAGFEDRNSFHPTFAYEAAWNVALAGGIYGLGKAWTSRPPGALFATYLAGYALGRFGVEGLRIDESKEFAGLRTNQWASLGLLGASAGALAIMVARRGRVA